MLRDFAELVRNLVGDSKVQKPNKKSTTPLRDALVAHGGRETGITFICDEIINQDWTVGFVVLVLKDGRVWKMPGDKLYAMYRDYLKLAELEGGSSIKDIVEGVGGAVVVFNVEPMNVGLKVHMARRSTRAVLDPLRELRSRIETYNKTERAANGENLLRTPATMSFRVIAYEGERVFRNAILR